MRRALVVGIDEYDVAPLRGCVHDALEMQRVLSRHDDGTLNCECRVFTGPPRRITRQFLRSELVRLLDAPAELAVFHFSGHGMVTDTGGTIVTQDAVDYDEGVGMYDILALVNKSPVAEVVILLDCCHSGAFGEIPSQSGTEVFLRTGASVLAASRREGDAVEGTSGGMFTSLVVEALEGGAAGILGNVTAANVYAHLDEAFGAWDQRPMFKAHVSRFVTLRQCEPRIDLEAMMSLLDLFETETTRAPLLGASTSGASLDAALDCLRRLERAGLVDSNDDTESGHRLTWLGRYYWRLVKEGKI